jgi:hypothetical protein
MNIKVTIAVLRFLETMLINLILIGIVQIVAGPETVRAVLFYSLMTTMFIGCVMLLYPYVVRHDK